MTTKAITEPHAQLNLSVVALVALVAIVGLVALVLNSGAFVAPVGFIEPNLESAGDIQENLAGDAAAYCTVWAEYKREEGWWRWLRHAPDSCR